MPLIYSWHFLNYRNIICNKEEANRNKWSNKETGSGVPDNDQDEGCTLNAVIVTNSAIKQLQVLNSEKWKIASTPIIMSPHTCLSLLPATSPPYIIICCLVNDIQRLMDPSRVDSLIYLTRHLLNIKGNFYITLFRYEYDQAPHLYPSAKIKISFKKCFFFFFFSFF